MKDTHIQTITQRVDKKKVLTRLDSNMEAMALNVRLTEKQSALVNQVVSNLSLGYGKMPTYSVAVRAAMEFYAYFLNQQTAARLTEIGKTLRKKESINDGRKTNGARKKEMA